MVTGGKMSKRDLLHRTVKILDNCMDRTLFFVCILIFFMGAYALYDSYMVYYEAVDSDILRFKPGYGDDAGDSDRKIEGHMAAWLTMNDSNIDYPVMQGEDNSEYLSKDSFGDYSLAGSIFLDSRNTADFSDDYSLIYGHHMEHGMMFGALDAWLDKSYCDEHRTGELIVEDMACKLEVFAVLEVEATREELFAPTEVERDRVIAFIREHARILYEDAFPEDSDRIVALSTCKFPDTAEGTIVVCRIR